MTGAGPVIVLSYARSGLARLHDVLQAYPDIAWITGPDLVQLCGRLVRDWQAIDGRPSAVPPRLAQTSIKALVGTMLTVRLADSRASRWCLATAGDPAEAATFTQLYPMAQFICLHRRCADMVYSGLAACRWGLSGYGYGFDPFAAAHPGNPVAALADYWATHTESILGFERAHPGRCLQVRYEDLVADAGTARNAIEKFLDLGTLPDGAGWPGTEARPEGAAAVGCGAEIPAGRIPPHVQARIGALLAELGYPPLTRPG